MMRFVPGPSPRTSQASRGEKKFGHLHDIIIAVERENWVAFVTSCVQGLTSTCIAHLRFFVH